MSVLSEFLDSRSGEIRRERGETIRKRVLEVWGVVDGSYLESVDPSKIVLRSFQRGAPRYNETYDIGPVLKRMDELWDIGSRKSVRALLIMVIKLQTLERSMSISKVRIEDLNVRVGFFKYLGMKGDKKDRLTWSPRRYVYRNPQYPSRCFFTVFEQYCKLFKIDLERDKASFLIRSLSSIKYGVGSDTISNVTKEVLVDAGVPDDYKAHSFRMAVASHLVDCGILIEVVMKIGGWKSKEVFTNFYLRIRNHQQVVDALNFVKEPVYYNEEAANEAFLELGCGVPEWVEEETVHTDVVVDEDEQ